MKKIILTTIALVSSLTFFGQNTFPATGNVGIGTTSPQTGLDIKNDEGIKVTASTFGSSFGGVIKMADGFQNTTWRDDMLFSTAGGFMFKMDEGGNGISPANSSVLGFTIYNNNNESVFVVENSTGRIGIGTDDPLAGLDIKNDEGIRVNANTFGSSFGGIIKMADGFQNTTWRDDMLFSTAGGFMFKMDEGGNGISSANSNVIGFNIYNNDNESVFAVENSTGYVGIGSTNPDSELTVKGKIHCEEVQVDLAVPADYVFEKYYTGASELKEEYTMPTLEEVEAYTKENHHLPNIPSAQEIKEEGLYLKEMTNLLLQKIEELTLYTIEQEKRIKVLEAQLTSEK